MNDPTLHLEALAGLIDRLIEQDDPATQERLLVEEICQEGWAQAASLMRQTGPNGPWIEILARGARDGLPTLDQVAAIDEGSLPGELPLGTRALFAADSGGRVALGLGGCKSEEFEDLLSGLLDVFCRFSGQRVESVWGDTELLDLVQPPSPTEAAQEEDDEPV